MDNENLQSGNESGENLLEVIEQHMPDYEDVRVGMRFPRWLRWLFNLFLLFIIVPVLAFQIPWVQSKTAEFVTSYLSKELKTTVSVDRVSLGIFNRVIFEDFYLEDLAGDTLVYAGNLRVNHSGLYFLLFKKFNLETLTLENASISISRKKGEAVNNLHFVLTYFGLDQPKERDKAKRPVQLNLRHFFLNNVRMVISDEVKGALYDFHLAGATAHFDVFNLQNKLIEVSTIDIRQPDIAIISTPETPLSTAAKAAPLVAESLGASEEDTLTLKIKVKQFSLSAGRFALRNLEKEPFRTTGPEVLNYNWLDVFDINLRVKDLSYNDLNFYGEIENMSARDSSGFVLENLSVKNAAVTCTGAELYGLELKTPNSILGDTLIFRYNSYRAFDDFENDVRMEARFHNADVMLSDIMTFAPALNRNTFFRENREEKIQIEGLIKGPVNRLDGRNLKINIAGGANLEGSFSTRNLAVLDEQFLHLNLRKLNTNVYTLRKLIPDFKPPENFDRLGDVSFSGKFDGFFVDFVADGTLISDLGSATMFMNLKLKDGRENARYSGDLYLKNFNLGKWTGNPDFGKVTFNSHVKEGKGLTSLTAQAKLEATIDSFFFKGYKYENLNLNGQIQRNLFDGTFAIDDPNINFRFEGEIDFLDSIPSFNFEADINQLALKPLNIAKEDFQFNGKVAFNFKGTKISDALGTARFSNFLLVKNQLDTLYITYADISSTRTSETEKRFSLVSNLGEMELNGDFNIEKVPGKFVHFINSNFPGFAKRFNLKAVKEPGDTARFEYVVQFRELQNLFGFFEEKIKGFDESRISGFYDGFRNIFTSEIEIPLWSFGDVEFNDVYFRTRLDGNEGNLQLGVVRTNLSETQHLEPIQLMGDIYMDTLEFLLVSTNFNQILDNVNINGVLSLEGDEFWRVSFKQSDLVILNEKWEINTGNLVRIGNGSIETNNFLLTNGDQRIVLKSVKSEGLEFQLKNYPLQSLDFFQQLNKKNHEISGIGDVIIKVKDIFKFQGLSGILRVDNLTIHGDDYGVLRVDASTNSLKETVHAFASIQHDTMFLAANGYFNPPSFEGHSQLRWVESEANYFDFDLTFQDYPVRILTYFVEDVSEVRGAASTEKVRFYGTPKKPMLDGSVEIAGGSFVLNPLKTKYFIPEASVKVGSNLFDGTGNIVYDKFNNKAFVEGGITHENLSNFGLDVKISTEQDRAFLGFEFTSKDNPIFYGTAIGTGYVRITGDFKQANLYVNARTMPGSRLIIPIKSTSSSTGSGFLTFRNQTDNDSDKELEPTELRGMNMEFDLDLTQVAEMQLIFDKAWGDVLKGTGDGRVKIIMTREGRFDMYGQYVIASGDYLFTLMNLILNKPFEVEQGGTVTWTGDPFNATINVGAVYKSLSTSVYNFIAEYLATASSDLQTLARTNTPVDLTMKLNGSLFKPDIDFDIDFPSLESELRNYAENKIRVIRQDPNELNRQVFGLLVLGQFLPSGYTLQAGDVGIKTLSEMLSNQLSIYLTEFVSELFTGSNLIQGIDLDISYSRYTGGAIDDPSSFANNELQGRLKVTVSDRIYVHVGGNFDISGGSTLYPTNSSLLAGEFLIEYVLTKDRRFKIKAYNSTEPDIAGGRRNKIGVGLSFRKEFDSIADLLNIKKK